MFERLSIFRDVWNFLWMRRMWWMLPLILIFVLLGFILVVAQGSPLAPFLYTIF